MSVSLARRILAHTSIQPEAVHRALRESGRVCSSLLEALLAQAPNLRVSLEDLLGRRPAAKSIDPDRRWVRELPPGLCERLLAFPTGLGADGCVEVAVADPSDPHLRAELEAHLQRSVRLHGAPLEALLAAAGARGLAKAGTDRPVVRVSTSLPPASEAAIPLVRRSERPSKRRVSTTPGLGWPGSTSPSRASSASGSRWAKNTVRPTPAEVEGRLVAAASAEHVAEAIVWAGGAGTLVFAVRSERFELLGAAPSAAASELQIPRAEVTVLGLALNEGDYRGTLFECAPHQALAPWHEPGASVFVAPVFVREHPVLVFVMAAGEEPTAVARYGERLAVAAGRALELLVVRRKRSTQP